jgi:hypothetical protein
MRTPTTSESQHIDVLEVNCVHNYELTISFALKILHTEADRCKNTSDAAYYVPFNPTKHSSVKVSFPRCLCQCSCAKQDRTHNLTSGMSLANSFLNNDFR